MTNAMVSIPIPSDVYAELLFRKMDKYQDIGTWIEDIVRDFLNRTEDEGYWADEYYEWKTDSVQEEDFIKKYGDPLKGYHWQSLFLPNGTKISMKYKDERYFAEVKNQNIHYENSFYSPATLARKIANDTSRNAWRDLYIKKPNEKQWILANDLRKRMGPVILDDEL